MIAIDGPMIQKILIGEYVLLTAVYMFDGNYIKSLYWFGAFILSIAVLFMK